MRFTRSNTGNEGDDKVTIDTTAAATGRPAIIGIFGRVLKGLWKLITGITVLFYFFIILVIFGAVIMAASRDTTPKIPDGAVLILNPKGALVEQKTAVNPFNLSPTRLLGGGPGPQTLVKDVTDALDMAAKDDKIKAVLLLLDDLGGGAFTTSKLHVVAGHITAFRESGKKVFAYADNYNQSAYFLAAHADEAYLHPRGQAMVTGFGRYRLFHQKLLEDLDVTVNLFKVGEFKSAVEPYIRNDMSPEAKEANVAVLTDLWTDYTTAVEDARGLQRGKIQRDIDVIDQTVLAAGGDLAQVTVDLGLVDGQKQRDEMRQMLIDLVGTDDKNEHSYKRIDFDNYLKAKREKPEQNDGDAVAVIAAVGGIVDGQAPAGTIGGDTVAGLIRKAREDEDVKAIVLRVDSGGGSAFASEVIRREVVVTREAGKPVVASMGSLAASGGYAISVSADEIWAEPTTVTGSIGIFAVIPSFENTAARYGVYADGVGTSDLAQGIDPIGGIPERIQTILQSGIEEGYDWFLGIVAEGRGMTKEEVDAIAQGRIWSGRQALDRGLVDQLGGLDEAVEAAARLAELDDYSRKSIELKKPRWRQSLEDLLGDSLQALGLEDVFAVQSGVLGAAAPSAFGPSTLGAAALTEVRFLSSLNDPHNTYMLCLECREIQPPDIYGTFR